MLRGSAEGPGWQERGAQGRAKPPAEAQRGARSNGYRVLLLVALLVLADRWQLLHQAAVTLPVRLRDGERDPSLNLVTLKWHESSHSNCCYSQRQQGFVTVASPSQCWEIECSDMTVPMGGRQTQELVPFLPVTVNGWCSSVSHTPSSISGG